MSSDAAEKKSNVQGSVVQDDLDWKVKSFCLQDQIWPEVSHLKEALSVLLGIHRFRPCLSAFEINTSHGCEDFKVNSNLCYMALQNSSTKFLSQPADAAPANLKFSSSLSIIIFYDICVWSLCFSRNGNYIFTFDT